MLKIGLIREGKVPADHRVAFTPHQCKWLVENMNLTIIVQSSATRCFTDEEYIAAGIAVQESLEECDIIMGIKEVPPQMLLENKTYLFFSHTIKLQAYNRQLFETAISKKITLIDYECLTNHDGSRILGFGYFAGVVGAHNGIMAYCNRKQIPGLPRVYAAEDMNALVQFYMNWKMPPVKIAVTGGGRVANGIIEVMNLMGIKEMSPAEYLSRKTTDDPVFVHLKGQDLYENKTTPTYDREEFHQYPERYKCLFVKYLPFTQILINGVYWQEKIPRLFEPQDMQSESFGLETIADVTDDQFGSVPCNLGDGTIENPVYGVDRISMNMTEPYLPGSVDIMAVGNLPNELPKEASKYFGEQLIKFVLDDLIGGKSPVLERATILKNGQITAPYCHMREYGGAMTAGRPC